MLVTATFLRIKRPTSPTHRCSSRHAAFSRQLFADRNILQATDIDIHLCPTVRDCIGPSPRNISMRRTAYWTAVGSDLRGLYAGQ